MYNSVNTIHTMVRHRSMCNFKTHLNAIDLGRDRNRNLEHRRPALYRLRYRGRYEYLQTLHSLVKQNACVRRTYYDGDSELASYKWKRSDGEKFPCLLSSSSHSQGTHNRLARSREQRVALYEDSVGRKNVTNVGKLLAEFTAVSESCVSQIIRETKDIDNRRQNQLWTTLMKLP
ncbi:hypothetical protein ANN_11225 [Periplaneta americana]|uniref:Uncharacterized protein n=1 Tax=Periplaneta americana TaxID=6978 RepID=A0ABQ8T4E6_PERAM|nr:hypothetical protein ANN_11225 [Periplaneta americana]